MTSSISHSTTELGQFPPDQKTKLFSQKITLLIETNVNKKVLLRERKRHTARRVASDRYSTLSPDEGGGYPIQAWLGGYLIPGWGYPIPCLDLGWGTSCHLDGVPPPISWIRYPSPPPGPGMGYPTPPGWGNPRPDLGWGTPPQSRCGLTNKLKTVPCPIFQMRGVKMFGYKEPLFKSTTKQEKSVTGPTGGLGWGRGTPASQDRGTLLLPSPHPRQGNQPPSTLTPPPPNSKDRLHRGQYASFGQ